MMMQKIGMKNTPNAIGERIQCSRIYAEVIIAQMMRNFSKQRMMMMTWRRLFMEEVKEMINKDSDNINSIVILFNAVKDKKTIAVKDRTCSPMAGGGGHNPFQEGRRQKREANSTIRNRYRMVNHDDY
jgi:hypothetical protein